MCIYFLASIEMLIEDCNVVLYIAWAGCLEAITFVCLRVTLRSDSKILPSEVTIGYIKNKTHEV